MDREFDYVVIGAGSAGCVIASRLAEDPSTNVLLVEAGPRDRHPWLHVPLGIAKVIADARFTWPCTTEPEPGLHGRSMGLQTGRVLGGSSSINGMVYVRGHPHRYREWSESLAPGWSYEELEPYFQAMERCDFTAKGRGAQGRIGVTRVREAPILRRFIDACEQSGMPWQDDYNAGEPDGVSWMQLSTRGGRRSSTAREYLRRRRNLDVSFETVARSVIVERGVARGVACESRGGAFVASARREVILAAGALRSPQLLELSGIGRPEVLEAAGIRSIHRLPAVGENAQDHIMARVALECRPSGTLNELARRPAHLFAEALRYAVRRSGVFATSSFPGIAFVRADPGDPHTSMRVQLGLSSGASRLSTDARSGLDPFPGFHLGGYDLFPRSRGTVHVRSADPRESPRVQMNYLQDGEDRRRAVLVVRLLRRISRTAAMEGLVVKEHRPGPEVESDEALLDYYRNTGHTCWHPVATCRMGAGADDAVVDARLRVHGIRALRVADASVFPFHVSSNTNAPVIALAEKASRLIAREHA